MKLLYLMTEPLGIGGVQSDMLALSEDLTPRGHDVYVATTPGEILEELKNRGAKFLNINFHFNGPLGFWSAIKALRAAIAEHGIEVLAPQSVRSTLVAYIGLRVLPFSYKVKATNKRLPIVTTIHNIHNPIHFKYGGMILNRCCDHVIFESHYERNRLIKSGLSADKSQVIHSGIDTDRFAPLPPDQRLIDQYQLNRPDDPLFGIVARLSEEKGHNYLISAFKKVLAKFPTAKLMIIGDGPLREDIEKQISQESLEDKIIMAGTQRNIPAYLSIIDVFVLSSTRESFPLAAREAMAAGRAVIAPRIGGCPEVVDENKTGYLFESANIDELAEKMCAIIENKRFIEFGEQSRQRVVDLFSRKQWVNGDEAVYLSYLDDSK